MKKNIYVISLILFTLIITTFVTPFVYFIGGWLAGWLLKITIGPMLISGLSLMNINLLSLNDFPLFFGTLHVIASFFTFPFYRNLKQEK